jgi:hypothetical protein
MAVPFRIEIKQHGASDWIKLPEVHVGAHKVALVRKAIKLVWGTASAAASQTTAQGGWIAAFIRAPALSAAFTDTVVQFDADASFRTSTSTPRFLDSTNPGTTKIKNVTLSYDTATIYLDPTVFPKGLYDIRIKRGAAYDTGSLTRSSYQYLGSYTPSFFDVMQLASNSTWVGIQNDTTEVSRCMVARVENIWNAPPVQVGGGLALVALQAVNRSITNVSCVASGLVKDWDGSGWNLPYVTSSNPAPHYRDVLAGDLTRRKVRPDDANLVEWRQRCIDNLYEFNGIFDGRSMGDALGLLASAGYARPAKSETWGVLQDFDRTNEVPTQLFSPRNSNSFQWSKAFPYLPDGFNVTYRDREQDYVPTQVLVFRPGVDAGTASIFEAVDYIGITDLNKVVERATFDLAQATARSAFYSLVVPMEGIVCRRGDLVAVQHDKIVRQAGFARINSLIMSDNTVTGAVLDSEIPLAPGADNIFDVIDIFAVDDIFNLGTRLGVSIRLSTGLIITKQIRSEAVDSNVITFDPPFTMVDGLETDCVVVSGILGLSYKRMIVIDVQPEVDLQATLTLVDEAPTLWAVQSDQPPIRYMPAAMGTILTAWQPPPPFPFFGNRQPGEPKRVPPAVSAVQVDNPPFRHRGRTPQLMQQVAATAAPDLAPAARPNKIVQ